VRTYKLNPENEKLYQLECINFECKYSPDAVITMAWKKEYGYDEKCKKCGKILIETMANWVRLIRP
jgi:hypothetical protein